MIKTVITKIKEESILMYKLKGSVPPPPHKLKEKVVKCYADRYKCEAFVETGTFLGDMVDSQKDSFKCISSVELSRELYEKAVDRFKDTNTISLYHGDSGEILKTVIEDIPKEYKILFWLDGHYSSGITSKGEKNTPIINELKQIFENRPKEGCILIDDARLFVGKNDYPTISILKTFVFDICKSVEEFLVKDDIIRIVY